MVGSMRRSPLLSAVGWDSALVASLSIAIIAYMWTAETTTGRKVAGTIVALGIAALMLWRRRYPVAASVGIATLAGLFEFIGREAGVILIAAYLVAFYSVGAFTELRRAVIGFGLTYAATVAALFADPNVRDVWENAVFVAVVATSAWIGGVLVRLNRSRSAKLAELARQLEHERDERARLAVAAERGRIARELHDVVAHGVSLIVVQAGAGRHALTDDPQRAQAAFAAIEGAARQALAEMRLMLGLLRDGSESASAAPLPGLDDVDGLVNDVRHAGVDVDIRTEGEPRELPTGVDLAAFRVLQEALTNVRRHAPGAHASVAVRYTPAAIEIDVVDDGGSPDPARALPAGGHGLIGMRERVHLYGGQLEAGPHPGGGFAVKASIPLVKERV